MSSADVQRQIPRRLGAWAVVSVVGGAAAELVGRRRGDAAVAGFGRQCLLWAGAARRGGGSPLGSGAAVVVQGAFLLALDVSHARAVGRSS